MDSFVGGISDPPLGGQNPQLAPGGAARCLGLIHGVRVSAKVRVCGRYSLGSVPGCGVFVWGLGVYRGSAPRTIPPAIRPPPRKRRKSLYSAEVVGLAGLGFFTALGFYGFGVLRFWGFMVLQF